MVHYDQVHVMSVVSSFERIIATFLEGEIFSFIHWWMVFESMECRLLSLLFETSEITRKDL